MKCPDQILPEEYAMRFLDAILPFMAPLVTYVLVLVIIFVAGFLLFISIKNQKSLRMMTEAFVKHQEANSKALEDASMIQRNFNEETLSVQKEHAAKQEMQVEALTGVLESFLERAAAASPKAITSVEESIALQEKLRRG